MAGMGKGKTRFFVELEKALNQRSEQDVVAVAITFDGRFSDVEMFDEDDPTMSMAVEVVLRTLTMAYSIAKFDVFRKQFTKALRCLQSRDSVNYVQLLQECIAFIVEDVRSSGRPCKKFVLLIDEPMNLVESGIEVDALDDLRSALLDNEMPGFRVSMAMTALDSKPLGFTKPQFRTLFGSEPLGFSKSGRPVTVMALPTELSIDEMYSQWLPAHLPQLANRSAVDESTERHLKQLLTLTGPIPRATEILVRALVDEFPPDQPLLFTKDSTARVLTALRTGLQTHLADTIDGATDTITGATIMLNNYYLVHSILWKEIVDWTGGVNRAMIDSYLVNPPQALSEEMHYTPVMAVLSLCRLNAHLTPGRTLLQPVVEATVAIAFNATAYHEPHTLGRPLAVLGSAFITCKALAAELAENGKYSLFELLGIPGHKVNSENITMPKMEVGRCPESLGYYYHGYPLSAPLPRSYDGIDAHVDALRECRLKRRGVLIVKGHEREAWDGLWMLRKADGNPFVLAVAYQFHEVLGNASTAAGGKVSNHQVDHFRNEIVGACEEASASIFKYNRHSAAAAIAAGDFAFVYVDTTPSDEAKGDMSRVYDNDNRYIRLTGRAARDVLTDAGQQVLDIVRLSSTSHGQSQRGSGC
eukprot:gene15652-11201_t